VSSESPTAIERLVALCIEKVPGFVPPADCRPETVLGALAVRVYAKRSRGRELRLIGPWDARRKGTVDADERFVAGKSVRSDATLDEIVEAALTALLRANGVQP